MQLVMVFQVGKDMVKCFQVSKFALSSNGVHHTGIGVLYLFQDGQTQHVDFASMQTVRMNA